MPHVSDIRSEFTTEQHARWLELQSALVIKWMTSQLAEDRNVAPELAQYMARHGTIHQPGSERSREVRDSERGEDE